MKWSHRYTLLLLVGGSIVALDQATKLWVDSNMALYETRPVFGEVLDLHYIRNPGAAFGFLSKSNAAYRMPFFLAVSTIAIGIILYLFHKRRVVA